MYAQMEPTFELAGVLAASVSRHSPGVPNDSVRVCLGALSAHTFEVVADDPSVRRVFSPMRAILPSSSKICTCSSPLSWQRSTDGGRRRVWAYAHRNVCGHSTLERSVGRGRMLVGG